jgi:hypothetical protein
MNGGGEGEHGEINGGGGHGDGDGGLPQNEDISAIRSTNVPRSRWEEIGFGFGGFGRSLEAVVETGGEGRRETLNREEGFRGAGGGERGYGNGNCFARTPLCGRSGFALGFWAFGISEWAF